MLKFLDLEGPSLPEEEPVNPTTKDVRYPQDSSPAGSFGEDGVEPTQLPMMKQKYMQSPEGGIAELPGKLGTEIAQTADASGQGSWAGKPGQFSDKWLPQNALDAINKAGASFMGIKNANKNDLQLIQNFYGDPKNNDVLNQYDLNTNLFLRYLSGRGGDGLALNQKQGNKILSAIKLQEKNLTENGGLERVKQNQWLYNQYKSRFDQGHIPVYFGGSENIVPSNMQVDTKEGRDELNNSLGSFWAVPDGKGGYTIEETYNFSYGKNNKAENQRSDGRQKRLEIGASLSLNPSNIGRRLAIAGYGKSYKYKLAITPDGQVTVVTD